jgi:hypothetical protein
VVIGVVAGVAADGGGEAALVLVVGGVALVAVAGAPAAPTALGVALETATSGFALVGAPLGVASAPHAASAHTIEAAKARETALRIGIPMLLSEFEPILASTLTKSPWPTESSQRSRRSMTRR